MKTKSYIHPWVLYQVGMREVNAWPVKYDKIMKMMNIVAFVVQRKE